VLARSSPLSIGIGDDLRLVIVHIRQPPMPGLASLVCQLDGEQRRQGVQGAALYSIGHSDTSLNVASAASIMLYEIDRQRRKTM
jgi:hypothetical protein